MAFVQDAEGAVIDRFEGADNERTAGVGQLGEHLGVAQEVLDLDSGIEAETGVALVHPGHDPAGMARGVEEVGVGETDVTGPAATSWSTSARTISSATARTRPA